MQLSSQWLRGGILTEYDERDAVEAGADVREAPQQHAELQRVHQVLHQEQPATQRATLHTDTLPGHITG